MYIVVCYLLFCAFDCFWRGKINQQSTEESCRAMYEYNTKLYREDDIIGTDRIQSCSILAI
jgi:hypothetical protein